MKKLCYTAAIGIMLLTAACNGSGKTSGAGNDSGSVGHSGPADTTQTTGTGTSATSNGTSDTSKKMPDTTAQKPPQK